MVVASLPVSDAIEVVGPLPSEVELTVWDGFGPPPDGVSRVEFFVGRYDSPPPPRTAFELMPQLRVVQLLSAGFETWLPLVPDGVIVCNGRGVHGASTAELAVAGLLGLVRQLPHYYDQQRGHVWKALPVEGLSGSTVVVLGAGDIGRRVASALQALDVDALLVGRTARPGVLSMANMWELLAGARAVVVALPLTPETGKLVDTRFLSSLPDGSIVVNVSRGGVVDTEALLAEVQSGRLSAFLDVTDPEPLPPQHPLWAAPNVVLTPHVGGGTVGWERRGYALVREQLERFVTGAPLVNVVATSP